MIWLEIADIMFFIKQFKNPVSKIISWNMLPSLLWAQDHTLTLNSNTIDQELITWAIFINFYLDYGFFNLNKLTIHVLTVSEIKVPFLIFTYIHYIIIKKFVLFSHIVIFNLKI